MARSKHLRRTMKAERKLVLRALIDEVTAAQVVRTLSKMDDALRLNADFVSEGVRSSDVIITLHCNERPDDLAKMVCRMIKSRGP